MFIQIIKWYKVILSKSTLPSFNLVSKLLFISKMSLASNTNLILYDKSDHIPLNSPQWDSNKYSQSITIRSLGSNNYNVYLIKSNMMYITAFSNYDVV